MGCYLCAYLKTNTPKTVRPLPPTSPSRIGDELGTCWRCSVSACAAHATLYGRFECAICTPAVATQQAFGSPPAPPGGPRPAPPDSPPPSGGTGSAAAIASRVGQSATQDQVERVRRALDLIAVDYLHGFERDLTDRQVLESDEPNLVWNLAGFVSDLGGPSDFVPEVQPEGSGGVLLADAGGVSLDAVSAAARSIFAQLPIDPDLLLSQAQTVTGALLLAAVVAHEQGVSDEAPEALESDAVAIPRPWEMSYPVLLDPIMWVVATAYHQTN